ncbi:receptor activity-modifying protein 1 [Tautogolabrus adspersus]
MILNMLVPALILGVVESQTVNVTEGELSSVQGNQTFITTTAVYSTSKPENLTSNFYKDEHLQIEEKLPNNKTSAFIAEDDEGFQDQETKLPGKHCHQDLLVEYSHSICGEVFHMDMMSISKDNWCDLDNIIRPYNNMTMCLEQLSNMVGCYYPNPNIQDFFVEIHSFYFLNCSNEDFLLVDAPQGLVIALTLIPVSLIPILVYLVIWKSKVQE